MTSAEYLNLFVYFNFCVVTVTLVLRRLMLNNNGTRTSAAQRALMVWLSHAWLYFAVATTIRLFFNYRTPTLFMSTLGSAVYLHAFGTLALDAYYHLKRHGYWAKLAQRLHRSGDTIEPNA
jgi:hypothetical protein